jgi:tripartite-type tricarboxylate transporter receptor subunit TctC
MLLSGWILKARQYLKILLRTGDTMSKRRSLNFYLLVMLAGLASCPSRPAAAQIADFKDSTIGINIGYGPGGGYDLYARTLATHFGRHIPGNPSVVPRNMPGAGGMRVATFIYYKAPKDGTELGAISSSTAMEPLTGNPDAKFDSSQFSWIGSMSQDISFCGIWQKPGAPTSFQEMLTKETIFGSAGGASTSQLHPIFLRDFLHAKIKVIPGYAGAKEVNLAMQRGEVDGACSLFLSTIMSQFLPDVKSGRLKLVIQMGPKRTDVFGSVPSVYDFVTTDEDRQVLDLHFKQILLARPIVGPPGMSSERLGMLRKAFMDTMHDPAFLADARKLTIDIDPATGEEAEQLVRQFANYPPSVIEKARAAIGR